MMSRGFLSVLLVLQLASAEYSESLAVDNIYLAVSAYCGGPKFNGSFLQTWECGPACAKAGGVTDISMFENSDEGVYGFTGHYNEHCILVFRGTSTSDAWKTDLDSSLVDFNHSDCSGCQVENGFYKAYNTVNTVIRSSLSQYGCKDLSITGHSLGAALATLSAYDLGATFTIKDVYNFGSPRVGNPAFASNYAAKYPNTYRVTHAKDPVPHGPTIAMGFAHVPNEIYYHNTTSEGFTTCKGGEDKACADQYGGSLLADLGLVLCCSNDHLQYMQEAVTVATDGDSCTHVAVATAVQHAYLTTAAYCEPEDLRRWDCGLPCEGVQGGVSDVQVLNVPFQSTIHKGVVRGFVGHVDNRCVLSLRDLFSSEEGLAIAKAATSSDLEDLPDPDCHGCKVHKLLLDAAKALKGPLLSALRAIGCHKDAEATSHRRLAVVGHGLGSALGALVAFELKNATGYKKGTFGIEPGFQFGATRAGNQAFVDAFKAKVDHDIFRVTHHMDPFLQYPSYEAGFRHMEQELFFEGDATWDPSSYKRCPTNGEDPQCAMRHRGSEGPLSDHVEYLQPLVGVNMSASACKKPTAIWT